MSEKSYAAVLLSSGVAIGFAVGIFVARHDAPTPAPPTPAPYTFKPRSGVFGSIHLLSMVDQPTTVEVRSRRRDLPNEPEYVETVRLPPRFRRDSRVEFIFSPNETLLDITIKSVDVYGRSTFENNQPLAAEDRP